MKEDKKTLYRWTVGLLGGLLFWFFVLIKIVELSGYEKRKILPPPGKGLVMIFRHPSLKEPGLMPLLFFPWFLFNARYLPISAPYRSFYHQWWFKLFKPACIIVEEDKKRRMITLRRMVKVLATDRILSLAPGGSREWKGTSFKVIKNAKIEKVSVRASEYWRLHQAFNGKVIQRFEPGIGYLIWKMRVPVLPVWVKNNKIGVEITIGEQITFNDKLSMEEVVDLLENSLLKTGDK